MNFEKLVFVLILCGNCLMISAQNESEAIFSTLEGYWEGGFIKTNALQRVEIQFYKKDNKPYSLQIIQDWHPQFGEFELPVEIDSTGQISMNTGQGKALLTLDKVNLELIGSIKNSEPVININLKKVPPSPADDFRIEEVEIDNEGIKLAGHLHLPTNVKSHSAIIIVGGRSCYAGSTKFNLYAKLLRNYGVSVLAFNKRGTGKSTGDCTIATIGDLASDVSAIYSFLKTHPHGFDKIGVIGSSAGGWVMTKAEEDIDFDFMIGVVGPSTSVYEQQIQSMNYGVDFFKLSEEARKDITAYTEMMFNAKASESNYKRFKTYLIKAEDQGWRELLDDTDIPDSVEGINNLWVRRHSYDPGPSLKSFNKPFLGIYGANDWIVPPKENIDRLESLFYDNRADLLKTIIAPEAGHGTDVEAKYISLPNDKSYWRFFRISPYITIEIINFLKSNNFID